ncbi:MAG TPA: anaerobic C4-dicarboxylate transporter family protein [Candidatus Acidoferrum sp.]|nr:anaerobic C4-dicarboxylate transporter family protein [Candidatus Acidoferrum sp.]
MRSGLILLFAKVPVAGVLRTRTFEAGAAAIVGIFGLAWMGDTFIMGNEKTIAGAISKTATAYPALFALGLFVASVFLYSQAATARALMPLGISLGIPGALLIAMFPAVNGYFFIPNYGSIIAAIAFDRTGTTHVGRFILNHSFMLPGLIATGGAVAIGLVIAKLFF